MIRVSTEEMYETLAKAVSLRTNHAVVRITADYQPAGGPGSKVFPPTYPTKDGIPPYVLEGRFVAGKERRAVQLDSVPSQANRAEEALLRAYRCRQLIIPLMTLRHSGDADLTLTSLEFPHRYADAYLRDSRIDSVPFDRSPIGAAVLASSPADATGLFSHDPGSLVYGAWNSHRKGRQQKFPRAYTSEVVGWDPVVGARNAGRIDPVNLVGGAKPGKDGDDWEYTPAAEKVRGERLSEIGHGNIAPNPQHGGVTISSATRIATLSLAVLDRIGFGTAPESAALAARTALAAYALLADRLAFGRPGLWLRSGCELVLEHERIEWVDRGASTEPFELSLDQALDLFATAANRAEQEGLPLYTDPVILTPSPALAKAIDFSLTKAVSTGD